MVDPHTASTAASEIKAHLPSKSSPGYLLLPLHCLLDLFLAVVVSILNFLRDLLEQLLREDAQQGPCDVQGGLDIAVLIGPLAQELHLELLQELQILMLIFTE